MLGGNVGINTAVHEYLYHKVVMLVEVDSWQQYFCNPSISNPVLVCNLSPAQRMESYPVSADLVIKLTAARDVCRLIAGFVSAPADPPL